MRTFFWIAGPRCGLAAAEKGILVEMWVCVCGGWERNRERPFANGTSWPFWRRGGAGWPDVKHHQTQTHTRTVKLQPYFKAGAQYHKTLFIIRPE